jgi:hypothetical protein
MTRGDVPVAERAQRWFLLPHTCWASSHLVLNRQSDDGRIGLGSSPLMPGRPAPAMSPAAVLIVCPPASCHSTALARPAARCWQPSTCISALPCKSLGTAGLQSMEIYTEVPSNATREALRKLGQWLEDTQTCVRLLHSRL